MRPGKLDLAGGRWVPFVCTLRMKGVNLTGADYRMQIRLTFDALGAALIDIGAVATAAEQGVRLIYGGTDTITNHVTAGRLASIPAGSLGSASLALSLVGIRINETVMEAMPFPGERGQDAILAWDIHITPAGGIKQKYLGGIFTVEAGATQ